MKRWRNRAFVPSPSERVRTSAPGSSALAVTLGLSLVACAGSTPKAQAPPLPPEVLAGDPQRAPATVLLLEDLPAGWDEEPVEDSGDPRAKLEGCEEMLGAEESGRTAVGRSNEFEREEAGVSDEAWFYESEAAARAAFDAYFTESSRGCVGDAISAAALEGANRDPEIAGGAEVSADVGDLSVEAVGDESAGWGVIVTLSARGVALPAYADIVVVRVERVLLEFSFLSFLAPFDGPRGEILEMGVARARAALAS